MKEGYWTMKKLLEIMEEHADIDCVEFYQDKGIYISGKNDGKTVTIEMYIREEKDNGT